MSTARFISFVRRGLAAGAVDGVASARLTVETDEGTAHPEADLTLAGPGNVVGVQPGTIARRFPVGDSVDVTPGHLVFVDFADPGLPWSLSPSTPTSGRLVPWLALLVLPESSVQVQHGATPLPRISATGIAGYLPNPSEMWAWAHVEGDPDAASARSRIVSPLRTRVDTDYVAALVPLYEDGRRAGLGDAGGRGGGFAWTAADDQLETPAYDLWRFSTGRGRSVEDLLMALTGRPLSGVSPNFPIAPDGTELLGGRLPGQGGTRPVLRPAPGGGDLLAVSLAGTPDSDVRGIAADLRLDALGPADAVRRRIHRHLADRGVRTDITDIDDVDRVRHARDPDLVTAFGDAVADTDPAGTPRLGLPAYGRIFAGGADPEPGPLPDATSSASPPWYTTVNTDVGLRISAGLGVELVRRRQEELTRFAWDAAGAIDEANALLSRARAGVAVGEELHARLGALDDLAVIRLTGAAQARIARTGATDSVGEMLDGSRAAALADRSVRGALAAGGPLHRVAEPGGPDLETAAEDAARDASRSFTPAGTPLLDDVFAEHVSGDGSLAHGTLEQPRRLRDQIGILLDAQDTALGEEPEPGLGRAEVEAADRFWADGFRPASGPVPAAGPVGGAAGDIRHVTDPERAIRRRVHHRLPGIGDLTGRDPLAPVRVAPVWPEPLLEAVAAFAPDRVAPGVSTLPPDSIAMLELDTESLEALVVGANHELAGELVWRGFPGDLRHSPIRRVLPGLRDPDAPTLPFDAPEVAGWTDALGEHLTDVPEVWLVIRTEVFRRAPGTLVYLAEAARDADGERTLERGGRRLLPAAMGELLPGVVYVGFALASAAEARGDDTDPGWFVVFEQQPGERGFGLDRPRDHTPRSVAEVRGMDSWNRLAWDDVVGPPSGATPQLLPAGGALAGVTLTGASSPEWGRSSADVASILVQRPVTVAIHASDLLDGEGG